MNISDGKKEAIMEKGRISYHESVQKMYERIKKRQHEQHLGPV